MSEPQAVLILILDKRENVAHHVRAAGGLDLLIEVALTDYFTLQNLDDIPYNHSLHPFNRNFI